MRTSFMDRIAGPEGWLSHIPWWVWVPAGWFVTLILTQAGAWIDGSLPLLEFQREAVASPFYFVAPVAGYAYLTHAARLAFDRFRPALAVTDDEAAGYRHRISSTRPLPALLPFLIGGAVFAIVTYADTSTGELMRSSGLNTATWSVFNFASFGFHFALAALIIGQIRLVTRLHREAAVIDLFRPDPVHAFASLTSRAGAVVIVLIMYSVLTDPATFENQAYLGISTTGIVLGIATFLLPLLGLRNRLTREKDRLRDEVAARLSVLTEEMHEAIDARRLSAVGELKTSLDVLVSEQQRIRKISAWPWETATLRGFATTLIVPVTIFLITSLLSETLGL